MTPGRALLLLFLLVGGAAAWLFASGSSERGAHRLRAADAPEEGGRRARVELVPTPAEPEPVEPAGAAREPVPEGAERALYDGRVDYDELGPDEGLLQIRVIAIETRRPVAGVALELDAEARPGAVRALQKLVSDARGRVDCRVPGGVECELSTVVRAGEPGRPLRWSVRPVPAREYRTVVVQLFGRTDLVWHARVLDAASGAPLPEARVVLVEHDPLVEPVALLALEPGRDGTVRLECSSSRENFVRIEAPGYAARAVEVLPGHEEAADALPVALARASGLELCAADDQGEPLPDLEVVVSCPRAALVSAAESDWSSDDEDPTWRARTSAAGCARIEGLPPRIPLSIQLAQGAKPVHQTVLDPGLEPGRTAGLRVEIGRGSTITGRTLASDGEPSGHVALWLLPARSGARYLDASMQKRVFQRTVSDSQGNFGFQGVPAGRWFVGPEPALASLRRDGLILDVTERDERGLAPVAEEVAVLDGVPTPPVRVVCWSELYLSGRVTVQGGAPEDFAWVRARSADTSLSAAVDGEGVFRLGPLAPGNYEVQALGAGTSSPTVVVSAGTEGIVLTLPPVPGRADARR